MTSRFVTHLQTFLIDLVRIVESVVSVLFLSYYRPRWSTGLWLYFVNATWEKKEAADDDR